jgi:hypothetical protein
MKHSILVSLMLCLPSVAFAKEEPAAFKLNLLFVNGTSDLSNETLDATIKGWIAEAEDQYRTKPVLELTYTIEKRQSVAGTSLASLRFPSGAAFGKFMDDHFDNFARTETEGHLTLLVGDALCIDNLLGKQRCWGGMAFFPHDVNPFNRKRGIWLSKGADKYLLAHELGHFFSLKHTFEPYVGFNKQCNKDFGKKNVFNPALGHCNSCTGKIAVRRGRDGSEYYVCEGGASNVMDYCADVVVDSRGYDVSAIETLNVCQQERAAEQRRDYLTSDGLVNYRKLAGLRGEGACTGDAQCEADEYCTAGVLDLARNVCQQKKAHGATCTNQRQCASDRCAWGFCADADECRSGSDCTSGQYCGDPISGKRTCKALYGHGHTCTKAEQCATNRCSWGLCADADECRSSSDCNSGQYCGDPISGKRKCKDLLAHGQACTKGSQCASGGCSFFRCKK